MASIFASKLFITSSRQEKIRAAIADPINKELIEQLSPYVEFSEEESSESVKSSKSVPETNEVPRFQDDMNEGGGGELAQPAADIMEEQDKAQLRGSTDVKASTYVEPEPSDQVQISELANVVKGQLNADSHSKGVTRALIKNDNELWVYFNDDTNLNDVMTPVLENLNAPNFGYLKFNRFARSDNAIVFTLDMIDSDNGVKSENEINPKEFPGIDAMQKQKAEVQAK